MYVPVHTHKLLAKRCEENERLEGEARASVPAMMNLGGKTSREGGEETVYCAVHNNTKIKKASRGCQGR